MRPARYLPLLGLLAGCITPYTPNIGYPQTGYLVVEGNLNQNQPTLIQLSRTTAISDTITEVFEDGATVEVEGSDGSSVTLPETTTGQYYTSYLPMDSQVTYRVYIATQDGDQFESEYVKVIPSPPIDSIYYNWQWDGVHIMAASHNQQNSTRYYQYAYRETWEYHSGDSSMYYWDKTLQQVLPRTPAEQVYDCWRTDSSTNVLIWSTTNLEEDVADFSLTVIPPGDQRLAFLYSSLVDEYGISDSDYDYLQLLQTNTENLGSIFSPIPIQLTGNIHSILNPSEQVVGYVNASSVSSTRYWLSSPPGWEYYIYCPEDSVATQNLFAYYFQGASTVLPKGFQQLCCIYTPINYTPSPGPPQPATSLANIESCVDCTTMGGVNVKPSFWP